MKTILFWLIMFASFSGFSQGKAETKNDTWALFAKTKFEAKYYENLKEYLFYPNFPAELKALEGKEVTIEGFYIPYAPEGGDYIILSKYPQSQCFFCGGGGPESVVEVNIKGSYKFKTDDLVTVKGKLKLNAEDIDHVNFILQNAVVISK